MSKLRTPKADLTAADVRQLFHYDPDTGIFIKKILGQRVGSWNGRYYTLSVRGKSYMLHRIAWLHYHGEWPKNLVDHINGDPRDNRIANLRDCTQAENLRNQTRGKGFGPCGKKFRAWISVDNRKIILGTFATAEEARAAYIAAKNKYHGEFSPFAEMAT